MQHSRFTVAIHALTALAVSGEQSVTSEQIAESVNTNASFIRKVLGDLRRVGLITSQGGVKGGLRLALRPDHITLQAVYEAIEDTPLFALHAKPPNPECPVGGYIEPVLQQHFGTAERAMIASLRGVTLADVVRDVLARNGAAHAH